MSVQPVSYFQFWSHARLTSPLFLVSFYLIFVALYFMSRILYQVAFGNMTLSSLLCFCIYYLNYSKQPSFILSNNLVFRYSIVLAFCLNAILNIKNLMNAFKCILNDTWDTYIGLIQ